MKKLLFTLLLIPFLGSFQANAQGCQANFVLDSSVCPNIGFIDQSTSTFPIVEWYWNFDDGTTSNVQNPVHSFTADGNYNVCLTTVSADSCFSTYCSIVTINCIGGGTGCQANFVLDSSVCPNVGFIDMSTSTFPIVEWYWNFDDGTTSNLQNPTHTFSADGNYNVCLTTVSADSCVSTYCSVVNINCIGGGTGCQANFVLDSSVCPNFNFVDMSTSTFPIVEWYWNFDDGTTATVQSPSHTFSADGVYNVCLTTVSADSCVSTFCTTVAVNCLGSGGCSAGFTSTMYTDSTGGTILYLINTSTGGAGTSYLWDFGDGSTSTDQYPTHVYTTDGTYLLCLTISDSSCTDTYCENIVVTGSGNGFTLVTSQAASAGLTDLEVFSGMNLYPNPTSHNLNLTINSTESAQIEVAIVNVMGQIVSQSSHQLKSGENILNLYTDELKKGYYFVKISSDSTNVEAIRFVKN